ncbi:MAG: hypothetical protein R3C24_15980 [Cyanobacteriota/Melainabacteria group bacterium]
MSARDDLKQAKSLNSRLVQAEREKMTTALEGQKTKTIRASPWRAPYTNLLYSTFVEGDLEGAELPRSNSFRF